MAPPLQTFQDGFVRALDAKAGSLLGAALVLMGALQYSSAESRPVLDRWSYPFAALLALLLFAVAALAWRARSRSRRPTTRPTGSRSRRISARLFEAGVCFWGIAYCTSAAFSPKDGGRIFDLNFFGSTVGLVPLVEWAALALLFSAAVVWGVAALPKRGQDVASSVAATLALLVLLEGAARGKALLAPTTQGFPTYSQAIWAKRHAPMNSLRFRDRVHTEEPTPGVRRVLLVGDSYTYGQGVANPDDRLGERLAIELKDRTGVSWEAINAARSDTHTLDHIGFLSSMLRFQPDLVILVYVFNDIDYLAPVTERVALTEPNSTLGKLSPLRLLFINSYFFQAMWMRLRGLGVAPESVATADSPYADTALVGRHIADIGRFVEIARGGGAAVAVVPYDTRVVLGPPFDVQYQRFIEALAQRGVPVVPLAGAFVGEDYSALVVNRFDHHPNERANLMAARFLAAKVAGDSTLMTRRPDRAAPATGARPQS